MMIPIMYESIRILDNGITVDNHYVGVTQACDNCGRERWSPVHRRITIGDSYFYYCDECLFSQDVLNIGRILFQEDVE